MPAEKQQQIREGLDRILQSPAFRASRQCQKFLRYVVEHSEPGQEELLRERSIGIEVFGRAPDYDTGEDPVVRLRATEIRKRLAQYYQQNVPADAVRFELPAGSYRVEFHWLQDEARPPAPRAARPRPSLLVWALAIVLVGASVAGVAFLLRGHSGKPTALDLFWAPVLTSGKPVLICSGHPAVYFLSPRIHEEFRAKNHVDPNRGPYMIQLDPDQRIEGRDIIPVADQFVGVGDSYATVQLCALLARLGKPFQLRYGNDISFSDLRNSPAVLIGAFSNRWTLQTTDDLRFVFEVQGRSKRIRDRHENDKTWSLPGLGRNGTTDQDYAIVSRIFDSKSGGLLISAAGIATYGTRAAGEFLTDATRIAAATRNAPPDWPRKNMQVLLHTQVFGQISGPPQVVAVHFW